MDVDVLVSLIDASIVVLLDNSVSKLDALKHVVDLWFQNHDGQFMTPPNGWRVWTMAFISDFLIWKILFLLTSLFNFPPINVTYSGVLS